MYRLRRSAEAGWPEAASLPRAANSAEEGSASVLTGGAWSQRERFASVCTSEAWAVSLAPSASAGTSSQRDRRLRGAASLGCGCDWGCGCSCASEPLVAAAVSCWSSEVATSHLRLRLALGVRSPSGVCVAGSCLMSHSSVDACRDEGPASSVFFACMRLCTRCSSRSSSALLMRSL